MAIDPAIIAKIRQQQGLSASKGEEPAAEDTEAPVAEESEESLLAKRLAELKAKSAAGTVGQKAATAAAAGKLSALEQAREAAKKAAEEIAAAEAAELAQAEAAAEAAAIKAAAKSKPKATPAAKLAEFGGIALYINCIPIDMQVTYADVLVKMANEIACAEFGVSHYKQAEFGKGVGALNAALAQLLPHHDGTPIVAMTASPAVADVLSTLRNAANTVVQGV